MVVNVLMVLQRYILLFKLILNQLIFVSKKKTESVIENKIQNVDEFTSMIARLEVILSFSPFLSDRPDRIRGSLVACATSTSPIYTIKIQSFRKNNRLKFIKKISRLSY